jgi:hypothetical protein
MIYFKMVINENSDEKKSWKKNNKPKRLLKYIEARYL